MLKHLSQPSTPEKSSRSKILQLKDFRVGQWEKPYIRINTRELNRELYIGLSTLYTKL